MPAAAVVARIQPAATGALPIHCDVPSNLRYPSCPRFTIGSSGSAAKSRPLKTGCRPSSTGDRLVRAEPDPARHRRTAPTSRPPTRADGRNRAAGAATRPRSGPRPRPPRTVAAGARRARARRGPRDRRGGGRRPVGRDVPVRSRPPPVRPNAAPFGRQSHGCHSTMRSRNRRSLLHLGHPTRDSESENVPTAPWSVASCRVDELHPLAHVRAPDAHAARGGDAAGSSSATASSSPRDHRRALPTTAPGAGKEPAPRCPDALICGRERAYERTVRAG
ncbi:MAG: hypothetical protein JWR81_6371 [Pseudonocardia sp.]|jgi:hypothetical protein|nr:hypothetical protein [Pseudonocardia sp.]MDT7613231.1 hypothetical protein [Pseudonocardiales bacterium]